MSLSYSTLKTNVGNRVGDTTSAFLTIVGGYINHRYHDVLRRTNWYSINPDFSITATSASTVASAATYTMPSDFGKELYVYNSGSDKQIPFMALDRLADENPSTLLETGAIEHYSIFDTKNTSASSAEASAARTKKMRFFRAPTTDTYFTIPYVMSPADLSEDSDELAVACEQAVEYGATADAWRYKRAF